MNSPPIEVFSSGEQRQIEAEILRMGDSRAFGVLLCLYTGIRLGELCALKWENINHETRTMSIVNTVSRTKNFLNHAIKTNLTIGSPKSRHSVREIPLPEFLFKLTDRLRYTWREKDFILSGTDTPIDPRTYQKLFKKILSRAGVKDRKFHVIRHTFATRALESGVDVKTLSEILGHSNVMITLRVYAHSPMEQKIAAIRKMNNLYASHMDLDAFAVADSVRQT